MDFRMFPYLRVVCLQILFSVVTSNASECYHCYGANNAGFCRNHVTCEKGKLCAVEMFGTYFNLGCAEKQVCENYRSMVAPSNVLGRRVAVASVHCCDTDLCNTDFDNMNNTGTTIHKPGSNTTVSGTTATLGVTNVTMSTMHTHIDTTISMPSVSTPSCFDHPDCKEIVTFENACSDSKIAETICPRSCGRCCNDENRDCLVLIKRLSICKTHPDFAFRKCRLSCDMCNAEVNSTTVPSKASSVETTIHTISPSTTTKSSVSGNTTRDITMMMTSDSKSTGYLQGNTTSTSIVLATSTVNLTKPVLHNITVKPTKPSIYYITTEKPTNPNLYNTTSETPEKPIQLNATTLKTTTTLLMTTTVRPTLPFCTHVDHDDCRVLLQSDLGICNNNSTQQLCPHGCQKCVMPSSFVQPMTTTNIPTTKATEKPTTTRTTGVIVVG